MMRRIVMNQEAYLEEVEDAVTTDGKPVQNVKSRVRVDLKELKDRVEAIDATIQQLSEERAGLDQVIASLEAPVKDPPLET